VPKHAPVLGKIRLHAEKRRPNVYWFALLVHGVCRLKSSQRLEDAVDGIALAPDFGVRAVPPRAAGLKVALAGVEPIDPFGAVLMAVVPVVGGKIGTNDGDPARKM